MYRIYQFLAILIILGGMSACRSSRGLSTAGRQDNDKIGVSDSVADPFIRIISNYPSWEDLNVPVSLRLTSPKSMSISARVCMERGRCIDLSFRMLGFEIARVWLSDDSLVAVSRPKKIYLAESFSEITHSLPINISNIQDMLMGRPFILGASSMTYADSSRVALEEVDSSYRLLPYSSGLIPDHGFVANLDNIITAFALSETDPDITFTVSYAGSRAATPAGAAMDETELDLDIPTARYAASVIWKWGSAHWNQKLTIDPPSTDGLKRVRGAELLKIIKDL